MTSSIVAPRAAGRSQTVPLLVALAPLWLLIIMAVTSNAVPAVLSRPPAVASLPLGVVMESIALLWMLGGAAIVWRARSPVAESLALMLFTIPATVLVVFTPTAIEILQTLA